MASSTLMCLQIARDTGKQKFKAGLRIDRRIYKYLLFQSHVGASVSEAERETRREPERLVLVLASFLEIERRRFGHGLARRNQWNVHVFAGSLFPARR